MKTILMSVVLCFAAMAQASVSFNSSSKATLAVQQKMNEAIAEQCPMSVIQNWDIIEGQSEKFQANSTTVYFKSEFAVYGVLDDGNQPENGGLTIEAVSTQNQVQILSVKGLCR